MNLKMFVLAAFVIASSMATTLAMAGESVFVGGQRYTCTNTCVVTPTGAGAYTVRDCCGGKVSTKLP
jgi:Ca2+/H+ antiporter